MTINRNGVLSADLDAPVVLPTLNLDFANSQSLDERITFSRGSIGTFVDKNGLVSIASTNQPRFDYDPITGECKGLLIEEQRTNLVANSSGATFGGLGGLSTTTDGSLAPDGSNAIVYIPTTATNFHSISLGSGVITDLDNIGIATGSTYDITFSCWVKDYNNSDLGLFFVYAAYLAGTPNTNFTYQLRIAKPKSATWTGGNVGTGWTRNYEKVVPYPNGWYRFIQSSRYTRQSNQNRLDFSFQIHNNRNAQFYNGDGTSGIYVWGPQVETAVAPSQGAFETSYIPTSGSTVTRSPDLARLQEPYFSQFFNKYEGSVFVSFNTNYPTDTGGVYNANRTPHLFYIGNKDDGTYQGYGANIGSTSIGIVHRLSAQSFGQSLFGYAGFNGGSGAYSAGSPYTNARFCMSYDIDKLKATCDKQVNIANDFFPLVVGYNRRGTNNQIQSITTQVFNEITIGWGSIGGAGNRYLTGTIKKLQFYPKSLNDAQMFYLVS